MPVTKIVVDQQKPSRAATGQRLRGVAMLDCQARGDSSVLASSKLAGSAGLEPQTYWPRKKRGGRIINQRGSPEQRNVYLS